MSDISLFKNPKPDVEINTSDQDKRINFGGKKMAINFKTIDSQGVFAKKNFMVLLRFP